jgi:glycosyltransferase involved in cell wall biosynthesis
MKILYDYSVFQNQQYGGVSRYFYEIITRMLKEKDIKTDLFQGIHINEYDLSSKKCLCNSYIGYNPKLKISPFIKTHIFKIPNKILFSKFYRSSNIDLYHPTYYYHGIKKHHNVPIVLTVYDMIHELYPNQLRYSKYTIDAKRISIEEADKIICISNNTKKDLMRIYNVPEDKIEVIYLANSLKKQDKCIDVTGSYGISKPYLLYVGDRNGVYKNFSTLLDVYTTSLKDRFDLVCFGGGPFNKNELSVINKVRCGDKVFQLSGHDYILSSMYSHAFAFICPSFYEGFGLPLLEAMGMGCPVIASNTSSIPEVVGDAGILFNPESKYDLINAIELLENNTEKYNELIKCGFVQESKFSWDTTAKKTAEVYKEVIG